MDIYIDQAINHMVETFCPKFTKGKVFTTTIDCRYKKFEQEKRCAYLIHMFFDCSSNYIKVAYKITDFKDNLNLNENILNLNYAGNHDSCWREWISLVKKEMYDILLTQGINMYNDHSYINFSLFHKTQLLDAKLVKCGEDNKFFNLEKIK